MESGSASRCGRMMRTVGRGGWSSEEITMGARDFGFRRAGKQEGREADRGEPVFLE